MKKTLSVLCVVAMIVTICSIGATAAAVTSTSAIPEMFAVEVSSNQDSYDWGDEVLFTVKITNISGEDCKTVKAHIQAKKSKLFPNDAENTTVIDGLKAGETKTVEVKALAKKMSFIQRLFSVPFALLFGSNELSNSYTNKTLKVKVGLFKHEFGIDVTEGNFKYYLENSKDILKISKANTSNNALSEKEAIAFFAERGFTDFDVTFDSTIDGVFVDDTTASANSNVKHPMYQTFFRSDNGDIWTVFIIDGEVFANPASFNIESSRESQLLISESNQLTSYDIKANKFYETIPKESVVVIKTVNRIDSDTLGKLTLS